MALLLLAAPPAVQAQFTYTTNNGAITLAQYTGSGGAVVISNFVTSIGIRAFYNVTSLTSVTIPGSVASVGEEAFYNCPNLTSVSIPGSVTNIGNYAFEVCSGLTSVTIPASVTRIGDYAFMQCSDLTSIAIPVSVASIGDYAFMQCANLTNVYFTGNAPTADSTVFFSDNTAKVYYLPGTTGWSNTFAGLPTAPWFLPNPMILNSAPSVGAQGNAFGFTISWTTNASVVVEASTNLANPVWTPIQTNALTNGLFYFSEAMQKNIPGRFYRIRSP